MPTHIQLASGHARRDLDRVVDILSSDHPGGVALLGNEGVGKSTLAAQAAERLGLGESLWVIGTLAQSAVPFGAFGPLLDIQEAGKPAAMLSAAAESHSGPSEFGTDHHRQRAAVGPTVGQPGLSSR